MLTGVEAKALRAVNAADRRVRDVPSQLAERLRARGHPRIASIVGALQIDSPLVLAFVATCVTLHAVGTLVRGENFARDVLGVWPWSTFRVSDLRSYPQLFTHVLGHASWQHLNGNLVNFLLVGPQIEREYGLFSMLKIMVWTAVFSALSHMALGPSNGVQIGSSGVVFSLILLSSLVAAQDRRVPLTFVCQAVVWCWTEIGASLFSSNSDGISHLAHLSGALVGTFAGYSLHYERRAGLSGGAELPSPTAWWRRLLRGGRTP